MYFQLQYFGTQFCYEIHKKDLNSTFLNKNIKFLSLRANLVALCIKNSILYNQKSYLKMNHLLK